MSPKLQSLLDQTQAHHLGTSSGRPHWVLFDRDVTQLGDLIIRECAHIAELKEQGSAEYDKDISVGWYMKQYFGEDV